MRRLPLALTIAALVILAGVGSLTGSSAAPQVSAPVTIPVTALTLVCPPISGSSGENAMIVATNAAGALTPPTQAVGEVRATVLAGRKSTTTRLHLTPNATIKARRGVNQTVEIVARGSIAAALAADQLAETGTGRYRGLRGGRCETPGTDWWFAGAEGRVGFSDTLTVANPAPTAALVAVSIWSDKGQVANSRLDSVRVPARSVVRLPMATVAPDRASLVLHVHANSGAVTATVIDRRTAALRSNGGDNLPPTQGPTRHAVLSGFAAGMGPRWVIVGNPTPVDATVTMRLAARSGTFTPTVANQLVIPAGRTRAIRLTSAFGSSPGAVEVNSDQPVVSEGLSVTPQRPRRPDLMWVAATPALDGSAVVAAGRDPDAGPTTLVLTAPQGATSVRVTGLSGRSRSIAVPAGRTVSVDITDTIKTHSPDQWSFVVAPKGPGPVYGARMLSFAGAHGALVTGQPLVALPGPTTLTQVREDPRVAVNGG